MNAEKLLPCPWCGAEARLERDISPWVNCVNSYCELGSSAGVEYASEAEAIAAWNTRPAPTEAEVEAAAKRIFDFSADPRAPGWKDVSHDTRDHYRHLARAALGVGDG